jgi:hypothetical protein
MWGGGILAQLYLCRRELGGLNVGYQRFVQQNQGSTPNLIWVSYIHKNQVPTLNYRYTQQATLFKGLVEYLTWFLLRRIYYPKIYIWKSEN